MPTLSLRVHNRALSVWSAFALVPALLTGALFLAARPSLALQEAKAEPTDAKTYTITRNFTAKEANHYKIGINTKANIPQLGGDVTIITSLLMKEAVKSITDTGTITLQSEFESASWKVGGMEQELTALMPTITTTIDKQGHVLDTKMAGGDAQFTEGPGAQMINSLSQQGLYPLKPVKIGETWKIDPPKPKPGDKSVSKMTGTATLAGLETIDGVPTLKIKTTVDSEASMDNPLNPGEKLNVKAHSQGTNNIEVATGKLIKVTATSESEGGPFGKTTSETSLTLVKDDGKTKPVKKDAAK